MPLTKDQQKAIETVINAHDELSYCLEDLNSMASGGQIGWDLGCEMRMVLDIADNKWKAIQEALKHLYMLVEEGD